MNIQIFIPCFVDACFPNVGISVVRILEKLGHKISYDTAAVCCGQPGFNAGYWDEARLIASKTLAVLKNAETVVVPSGSCSAMLKVFYPELFEGLPEEADAKRLASKVFEFSEFLVDRLGVTKLGAKFPKKVTFHDGCHGLREMKLKQQSRRLLAEVEGLELIEMKQAESCCGFGGTFSVKFPAISAAMAGVKCASAIETGAEYIISNDSSCLMQIQGLLNRNQSTMKSMHLAEVLAGN